MIIKSIQNSVIFSAKRNNKNELVLILLKEDLSELEKFDGLISHVGFSETNSLEIHAMLLEDLIVYQMPYIEELKMLVSRYEIDHVVLAMSEDEKLENPVILFEGFLKLFNQ